jgi:hypothetical protein
MIIPKMLKKKCASATCIAVEVSATKAARIEVIVVPILAPRVRGYICSTLIRPTPTIGVKTLVVTLELCTAMVIPHPIAIDT